MRISRKKRPEKLLIPHYKKNQFITAERVLLLDENNAHIGVMPTKEAIILANEKEMDLVEINPKSDPPVCKIVDFSEFKYQKEKQARKQKAHSHTSEIKGLRLSIRISDHDLEFKKTQAEKFLNRGDKVKLELIMRGRENSKIDIARGIVQRIMDKINEATPVRIEQDITRQGRKITSVIAKK